MERRSSTQDGTDSTIRLLISAESSRIRKRGSAETVRAMHSVAVETSGRIKASFRSAGSVAPRTGGGHGALRSTATGTSNDPARSAAATNAVKAISETSKSGSSAKQTIGGPVIFDRKAIRRNLRKRNRFLFAELGTPVGTPGTAYSAGKLNRRSQVGANNVSRHHSSDRADRAAGRRVPGLAVQHGLGLLPGWRHRHDPGRRVDPASAGAALADLICDRCKGPACGGPFAFLCSRSRRL